MCDVEVYVMAYFLHIYCMFTAYLYILNAYFFIIYVHILCIFCAYFGMQLHIKCIFQFCRSPGRAGSGLFRFRSGSALATASYQHFIARKHTHLPGSCDRRTSPGRVALGLAAPGPLSAGLSTAWPSISSHQRTPRDDAGLAAAAPPAAESSRCSRRRRLIPSNQPRFLSIQLPAASVLLPPCAHL